MRAAVVAPVSTHCKNRRREHVVDGGDGDKFICVFTLRFGVRLFPSPFTGRESILAIRLTHAGVNIKQAAPEKILATDLPIRLDMRNITMMPGG